MPKVLISDKMSPRAGEILRSRTGHGTEIDMAILDHERHRVGAMQRGDMQHARAQQRVRPGPACDAPVAVFGTPVLDLLPDQRDLHRGLADRVQRHARAGLAPPLQHARIGQRLQRTVDSGAGAAELLGQSHLAGDDLARGPFARMDAAQHLGLDGLPVAQLRLGHGRSRSGAMARA